MLIKGSIIYSSLVLRHGSIFCFLVRHLLPKLYQLPMMIVAMATPNMESRDSQVMKEGQELATTYAASFVVSSGEEWGG